jgi:hypothetical protein
VTEHWVLASPVDRPDVEFICAHWEPLAPNGNIQMASTCGERSVTKLWTGHIRSLQQRVRLVRKVPSEGGMAILASRAIKGVCG